MGGLYTSAWVVFFFEFTGLLGLWVVGLGAVWFVSLRGSYGVHVLVFRSSRFGGDLVGS